MTKPLSVLLSLALACTTTPALAEAADGTGKPFTIVLNRYATQAVQLVAMSDRPDQYQFRRCLVQFSGAEMNQVALTDCRTIDNDHFTRVEAIRILNKASEGVESQAQSRQMGQQSAQLVRFAGRMTAFLSALFIGIVALNFMGLAKLKPGVSARTPLLQGLFVGVISVAAFYSAAQIEKRIADLQTSLTLVTPDIGDVFVIEEVFPDEGPEAQANDFFAHHRPPRDMIKSDAQFFTDRLVEEIRKMIASLPGRA